MTRCRLFIDADGHFGSTDILVLGEDGSALGQLDGVVGLNYQVDHVRRKARVDLTLLSVPGRFLADDVLIKELGVKKKRRWWRR